VRRLLLIALLGVAAGLALRARSRSEEETWTPAPVAPDLR
jgi:hypothetical protein